jgi:hypothetical protein
MMGGNNTVAACHSLLLADSNIDAVISLLPPMMPPPAAGVSFSTEQIKAMQTENRKQMDSLMQQVKQFNKPAYLIRRFLPQSGTETSVPSPLNRERIPEYPHQRRAARVLRHLVWYREYLEYRKA